MKQGVFGFYTDRSERLVETLRIDFYERTYSHICDMPRSRIGKAEYGKTIPEVLVPQEMFAKLVRIAQEHMSGMFCSGGFCGLSEEEGDRTYEQPPRGGAYVQRLPHDRVWAAIRLEADGAELARVAACGDYEREDYFDAEALCTGIRAFCAGKLSVRSFADWCIVLSHAFSGGGPYRGDRYLWELYDNIGYFSTGSSFWRTTAPTQPCAERWASGSPWCGGMRTCAMIFLRGGGRRPLKRTALSCIAAMRSMQRMIRGYGFSALPIAGRERSTIFRSTIPCSTKQYVTLFFRRASLKIFRERISVSRWTERLTSTRRKKAAKILPRVRMSACGGKDFRKGGRPRRTSF